MSSRSRSLPRVMRRPDQGWSSLLLLLSMLTILGLSIADARPLSLSDEEGSLTSTLAVVMVAAGLIGFVLARSSIGVVRAHVIGATVAVLVLLLVAGASLLQEAAPLPLGWDELTDRVAAVWVRLDADVSAYMDGDTPWPTMATFLVFGALCWTTAQFSAFSIFRYGRGGPAVMAIGAVLFLNVGLDSVAGGEGVFSPLPTLALFSALAMLLLVRLQLVQQRVYWARRYISDTGEVSRLFLRSGVIFVALTVVSATSLAAVASVDAQEFELGSFDEPLEDIGSGLSRLLGIMAVPQPSSEPTGRDREWKVASRWEADDATGTAFRATVEGRLRGNYWWGWADDAFDGWAWKTTALEPDALAPGEPLPVEPDATTGGSYETRASIVIGDAGPSRSLAFRPAEATVFVDQAVTYNIVDDGGGIGDIAFEGLLDEGDVVVVESLVRDYSDDGTSPTATELRAAGDDYPGWTDLYLQGADDPGINGPRVSAEAKRIEDATSNAYDAAVMLQQSLRRAGKYEYETNMNGVCDGYRSIPECLLAEQKGFCQHYATTMVMVLRKMGNPARIVTGYLRGEQEDGTWVVPQRAFHNWAEAYFPDHGWIRFDPTPGRGYGQQPTEFEDSPPPGSDRPGTPEPTIPADETESLGPEVTPVPVVIDPGSGGGSGSVVYIVGLVGLVGLLLSGLSVWLLFRLRRLPHGDGGLAYGGIVRLATRLGYGPDPAQTEYEYASALSEVVPSVREELYVVTDARVQTAYGQQDIERARHGALQHAYARIRTALLRLSLRVRH